MYSARVEHAKYQSQWPEDSRLWQALVASSFASLNIFSRRICRRTLHDKPYREAEVEAGSY